MHDPLQTFGANLRRARKSAGLSQEELGDAAGMHRTHVSKIERAKCEPGVRSVIRLLQALELDGGPLFEGLRLSVSLS
ncbi:MAG TPA: helix-turn-helix transcriptional regulator [Solirubrobacteraceae bacterium]|jgi:transcriptional regulator with XRE-family HTH domain